jgi:PTH1 family peptidyl-tRNA hydrolase
MQLIIGLGNPGKEYQKNRHNAGFMALDFILKDNEAISCTSKFDAKICELHQPEKVFFVYPQTFMNNSGRAVKQIMDFYKIEPKDILVIHDEIDLALGTIKFADNSGHAGHNGVASIIEELGTKQFNRIRIGVETRQDKTLPATEAFVLQNFSDEELKQIPWDAIKARLDLRLRPSAGT